MDVVRNYMRALAATPIPRYQYGKSGEIIGKGPPEIMWLNEVQKSDSPLWTRIVGVLSNPSTITTWIPYVHGLRLQGHRYPREPRQGTGLMEQYKEEQLPRNPRQNHQKRNRTQASPPPHRKQVKKSMLPNLFGETSKSITI